MTDTIESLSAELDRQKQTNAKLLALLQKIEWTLPDSGSRIPRMLDEVKRTKAVLDDCKRAIEAKR